MPHIIEVWKAIPGFEGAYEVSDQGRVRSLDRILTSPNARRGFPKRLRGRVLKGQKHSGGYEQVGLSGELHLVSWLVLTVFRGPRPLGMESCHNDGDKWNNTLKNLRWGTHVENCDDRRTHGTNCDGERNASCKLTIAEVAAIRASEGVKTRRNLSEEFGVSESQIGRILRGEERRRG
jgi:hypothetical protein